LFVSDHKEEEIKSSTIEELKEELGKKEDYTYFIEEKKDDGEKLKVLWATVFQKISANFDMDEDKQEEKAKKKS
ncbi:10381_t:CDS:2, partial [Scutellospora calospora]